MGASCCYHLGCPSRQGSYETFTVAYAKGDERGDFTATLIERVSSGTFLRYANSGADLEIKVCLSSPSQRNIGFIYSKKDPKVTTAYEGRLTQIATVTVTDCRKRCVLLPSTPVMASMDYDFNPDMTTINQHAFSLGQLEMNPLAKEAAMPSLYGLVADTIVDFVNQVL